MINYIEKGLGLHRAIKSAGYRFYAEMENGVAVWKTTPGAEAAVQDIIDNYDEAPDRKADKTDEIKAEGLARINIIFPAISDMDELQLVAAFWMSIAPAARTPIPDFEGAIDIYTTGKNGIATVNAMTDVAAIKAFDPATDIMWP